MGALAPSRVRPLDSSFSFFFLATFCPWECRAQNFLFLWPPFFCYCLHLFLCLSLSVCQGLLNIASYDSKAIDYLMQFVSLFIGDNPGVDFSEGAHIDWLLNAPVHFCNCEAAVIVLLYYSSIFDFCWLYICLLTALCNVHCLLLFLFLILFCETICKKMLII